MGKDEFIAKMKAYTAGVIALGKEKHRPLIKGQLREAHKVGESLISLDETATALLTMCWNILNPKPKEAKDLEPANLRADQKTGTTPAGPNGVNAPVKGK